MPEVEMTRASPPHSISHKQPVSNFTNVFVTSQKSEARNRIRIRNSLTKDARWVRCSSWSLGLNPCRPTTVVCPWRRGEARRLRSRIVVCCVRHQRIDLYWCYLVLLYVPCAAAATGTTSRLCSVSFWYLSEDGRHFPI